MSGNLRYQTPKLAEFFLSHRRSWDQFYPSERWIFERIMESGGFGNVLDVGCAAGGLGMALAGRGALASYTGVDINEDAIARAPAHTILPVPARFISGDILDLGDLGRDGFDTVVSLSCADWNVETTRILERCWSLVVAGGRFVLSLRLSPERSLLDFRQSYQYLSFDETPSGREERAPYVVFNSAHALEVLTRMSPQPAHILGYGYWGDVSASARTQVKRVVFAVFAVTKAKSGDEALQHLDLRLPRDTWGVGYSSDRGSSG